MDDRDEADLKLEQLVDRALRELPVRRAPSNLEFRVFETLARQAALPWWKRSFAQWPRAARTLLLGVCGTLSGLTIIGGARIVANLSPASGLDRELDRPLALLAASKEVVATLVGAIPSIWIYEGLALAAVLYAVLFALGAAAYRTLYLEV